MHRRTLYTTFAFAGSSIIFCFGPDFCSFLFVWRVFSVVLCLFLLLGLLCNLVLFGGSMYFVFGIRRSKTLVHNCRTKLKQTEVDCELLKRCCEKLTEDNRRLQKEVQELRALKLSPQFYMQMNPPTTLTMCPSCERVAVSSSSSSAAALASSTTLANGPTRQNGLPNIQRPIPISPWAKLPIQHRTLDASAPR